MADGDRVIRRVSWTGTCLVAPLGVPATGRQGLGIMRIADGKIAEEWELSNLLGLLQQLGGRAATFQLRQHHRPDVSHRLV